MIAGGHNRASIAGSRAVGPAGKSPIQSAVSAPSNVMASVGHTDAHAGAPPHRLHL